MRISHEYKFVYITIPKTASSTVKTTLNKFCEPVFRPKSDKDALYLPHSPAVVIKKLFTDNKWDWNNYFKFTFVRNPWDMVVSYYTFLKRIQEINAVNKTFKEFITINFNPTCPSGLARPFPITSEMDYIGQVENIQHDFDIICDKIGIPKQQLPHINKTKHKHYSEYYDNDTRDYINEIYKDVIDMFNYKFNP